MKNIKTCIILGIIKIYTEIRDVIRRYGENAQIYLGGIPMIADDMMSYIKSDIVVFGIGVFIFIILTLWFIFRNIKVGNNAITRMRNFCYHDDWSFRFFRMESYCNFIKLYCINAYTKYGNEYSCYCKIFTI